MNRRGFLKSMLVAGMAPAIVRADSLMRVIPRDTGIIRGFGLSSIKAEGSRVIYDGSFVRSLWPGINAFWGHCYSYSNDGSTFVTLCEPEPPNEIYRRFVDEWRASE